MSYEYDLGHLEGEISLEYNQLDSFKLWVDKLMIDELTLEAVSELSNVSLEGSKFDMLTSYIERVYTTIMNVVNKIIKFVKRTWTRIKLAPVSDKEVGILMDGLDNLKGESVVIDKSTHKLVKDNRAYFELSFSDDKVPDYDDLLKSSAEARKNMLNGDDITIELKNGNSISKSYIKRNLLGSHDLDKFIDDFEFLSVKNKYVYLLGKYTGDVKFGTGFKVLSFEIDSKNILDTDKVIQQLLTTDKAYDSLKSMMTIDELYRVVTGGIYEELEAIEHDLEADRLRKLKQYRSKSNDTLDDLQVHNENIQMHSKIVRMMGGFTKAFMYIGNGLLYDRKIRILTAKVILKQLKG